MNKDIKINPFCSAMAGIKALHFIDIKSVSSILPSGEGCVLTLKSGKSWSQIHFKKASAESVPDGNAYLHTVETTVPGKGENDVSDLMTMTEGRYVIRITDNNGIKWIVGDEEEGLRMNIKDSTDGSADGETGYTVTFSGHSLWAQMKLNP